MDRLTFTEVSSATRQTVLARLAPSTVKQYDSAIDRFFDFCALAPDDPFNPRFSTVLDFLQTFVTARNAHSTLRSYAAAIQHFYRLHPLRSWFLSSLYADFIKGAERLLPIPRQRTAIWDVDHLLECMRPSIPPSSFFDVGGEAALLLLLATGLRVADLTILHASFQALPQGSLFQFRDKRKAKINGRYSSEIFVPALPEVPRLCPLQALQR